MSGGYPPGAYGATPPGAYPPPPGYGAPNPYAPPPPKQGNAGLYAGVGAGCLVLLVVGVGVGFAVMRKVERTASAIASAVASASPAHPGVELKDARFFRSGSVGTLSMVGELVNDGTTAVASPSAKITLYDDAKTAVDSTTCLSPGVRLLAPGESVPCATLFPKVKDFQYYRVEPSSVAPIAGVQIVKLEMSGVEAMPPSVRAAPHKVSGKVTNTSSLTAKDVWIVVGLYDADGKISGAGQATVAGNDLGPGASAQFEVSVPWVAKPSVSFAAKAFGYDR